MMTLLHLYLCIPRSIVVYNEIYVQTHGHGIDFIDFVLLRASNTVRKQTRIPGAEIRPDITRLQSVDCENTAPNTAPVLGTVIRHIYAVVFSHYTARNLVIQSRISGPGIRIRFDLSEYVASSILLTKFVTKSTKYFQSYSFSKAFRGAYF